MEEPNKEKSKGNEPSNVQITEKGVAYEVPVEGSLGLLALGYRGLVAWREAKNKNKPGSAK